MDMQQLKLIMDTLASMGAQGKEAFIWWLVFDKALPGVIWLTTLGVVSIVVMKLVNFFADGGRRLEMVRNALGVGCPGPVNEREFTQMLERIANLQKK